MTCFSTCPTLYFPDRRLFACRILWARITVSVLAEPGPLLRYSSILILARSSVVESPVALLPVYPVIQSADLLLDPSKTPPSVLPVLLMSNIGGARWPRIGLSMGEIALTRSHRMLGLWGSRTGAT